MPNILRSPIFRMAALIVPAAVLVSAVFFFAGSRFTETILPVTYPIITFLHPEYEFREFRLTKDTKPNVISYEVVVRENPGSGMVVFDNIQGVPLSGGILGSRVYIVPIITLTLLLAWPFLTISRKLAAVAVSLPLILLVEVIDISLCIIGNIEITSRSMVFVAGSDTLSYHLAAFSASFLNTGGRQFLAILVFLLAIAPFHLKAHKFMLNRSIRGNDLCPCGSGKKYRKCCGRR